MSRAEDLTGRTFERLKVIRRADDYVRISRDKSGKVVGVKNYPRWVCQCRCGNVVTVNANHLKSGQVKSCGCLRRDKMTALGHAQKGKDHKKA